MPLSMSDPQGNFKLICYLDCEESNPKEIDVTAENRGKSIG
jgi:hypothetical protein